MIDTQRKAISGRMPIDSSPAGAVKKLLVASVFIGMGAALYLGGQGKIPALRFEPGVAKAFGALFGLAGLFEFSLGLRRWRQRAGVKRRQNLHARGPNDPWLFDRQWDSRGADESTAENSMHMLVYGFGGFRVVFLLLGCFLSFKNIGDGFFNRDGFFNMNLAYVVFGLLLAAFGGIMAYAGYRLLMQGRFGRARISFAQFPFFLGENLQVSFQPPSGLVDWRELTFTLRLVEEALEHKPGSDGSTFQAYQTYADSRTIQPESSMLRQQVEIPAEFKLPTGLRPTQLLSALPAYWELEVRAQRQGRPYVATFPLPVYAPPRAGVAGQAQTDRGR